MISTPQVNDMTEALPQQQRLADITAPIPKGLTPTVTPD
jgi:hypothetical protein